MRCPPAQFFAGLDWAAEVHAVCVMDHTGKIVDRFTLKHSAEGIAMLIRRLAKLADSGDVQVGIERPNGRLVDLYDQAQVLRPPIRRRPDERLRSAPAGARGEALTEALRDAVLAMATDLKALNTAVRDLDRSSAAHLGERPDGEIFTSLPRSGQINAAQILAEWGDCRQAYESPDSVAALAGCTPITKESGKHRAVHFRWACNKRFRVALTTFADNSRHASPWAAKIYNNARRSGKDHPHAVRILARAWIRVIWRCWLDGVPYDPTKHGAAAALTEPISA